MMDEKKTDWYDFHIAHVNCLSYGFFLWILLFIFIILGDFILEFSFFFWLELGDQRETNKFSKRR